MDIFERNCSALRVIRRCDTGKVLMKAAALVCMVMLGFPSFGPMAVYHFHKKLIRKEVKKQIIEGIALSELAVFRRSDVTKDKVRWVDEREFVLNGMYYDVVKWAETDSGGIVYCWPDSKESELERLRTDCAMVMLDLHRRDQPSKFESYKVYIKGFYRDLSDQACFVVWCVSGYAMYGQKGVVSVSHSVDHPPEQQDANVSGGTGQGLIGARFLRI